MKAEENLNGAKEQKDGLPRADVEA